jgi:hypothetical protein
LDNEELKRMHEMELSPVSFSVLLNQINGSRLS